MTKFVQGPEFQFIVKKHGSFRKSVPVEFNDARHRLVTLFDSQYARIGAARLDPEIGRTGETC
jgi:hypothetical protein